jgi:hypothetical protein
MSVTLPIMAGVVSVIVLTVVSAVIYSLVRYYQYGAPELKQSYSPVGVTNTDVIKDEHGYEKARYNGKIIVQAVGVLLMVVLMLFFLWAIGTVVLIFF